MGVVEIFGHHIRKAEGKHLKVRPFQFVHPRPLFRIHKDHGYSSAIFATKIAEESAPG